MISYTPTPRYDYIEEYQATKIHKLLAGQLKPSNAEIIERLRKESKRYEN